ncbi:MAG: Ger(x)C family spore germination protein [Eubacterium sp.]
MSKSFKIFVCTVMIASLLSGCMNTVHLKDLVVVEGMGIDSKEDKIQLIVQTLNDGTVTSGEAPKGNITINTEDTGETIVDAVSNMTKKLSKELFFGQNKIIVFGREIAESDFEKELDYFLRSSDSRPDVAVCVSDTSAEDIVESKENDAHIPCENMVYLLKNGQNAGTGLYVITNELLNMYSDKTTDICLPVVKKDKDSESIQTKGIGLFSKNKLVYVTNDDETLGFLIISDKITNCTIEFTDEELGQVGVEISHPKIKKSVDTVDGNIVFSVNVEVQLMIDEIEKGIITALDEEKIKRICTNAQKEITRLCTEAFAACRDNNSDALRIGEYLAKDSPESYEKLADDWHTYFKTVQLSVNVKADIKKISDNTQLD